jgi:hypothetical protein
LWKANGGTSFGISTNPPGFVGDQPSQQAAYLHINSNPDLPLGIYNLSSINGVQEDPNSGAVMLSTGKDTAFLDAGGNQYHFYTTAMTSSIPEPSTWALMIAGLGLLGGWQQRRLKRD